MKPDHRIKPQMVLFNWIHQRRGESFKEIAEKLGYNSPSYVSASVIKMRRLTTLLLLVFCGCDRAPAVLYPIETLVALPPEMHQFLTESSWVVTSIDGRPISESLSGVETLIAKHISDAINIALVDSTQNPYSRFRLRGDGTWHVSVGYWLRCERTRQENARLPVDPKKIVRWLASSFQSMEHTLPALTDRHTRRC